MKRYFKHKADIGFGSGMAYFEFDGEDPTRQVEVYGELWLSSLEDYYPGIRPGLGDQPLSELNLGTEHEISKKEFEEVWQEALKHQDHTGESPAT